MKRSNIILIWFGALIFVVLLGIACVGGGWYVTWTR